MMPMERYILAQPYGHEKLDFSRLLSGLAIATISRAGPQRRVQILADPCQIPAIRQRLPASVRVERAIAHGASEGRAASTHP